MSGLAVLHVVSELHPFVKTGGLADVARALPMAQRALGVDARWVVPGYPAVRQALRDARAVWHDADLFGGGPAEVVLGVLAGADVPAYVLCCDGHFQRSGGPYVDALGRDHTDNHRRFAALGWVASELAAREHAVLHAHDWQAGLAVAYAKLRQPGRPPCVTTIHNIDYPGGFDLGVFDELGLPASALSMHGVEFYGRVSFLKAGLYYADAITTVSPTYAREITQYGRGGGFEGLLRERQAQLSGILNGVDYDEWDPSHDDHLPAQYDAWKLERKAASRKALAGRFGLRLRKQTFLLGVVSRLVPQKGIDLLLQLVPWLLQQDAALVVLGSGEPTFEEALRRAAIAHPDRIGVQIGYDEALSHLVQAGCDAIAVPSRTEPCGLTQLYAMRYGSPPVVRRTGGLADSVDDGVTGFVFDGADVECLRGALERAIGVRASTRAWRRLQRAAMARDFGWASSARAYAVLYAKLTGGIRAATASWYA